MEYDNRATRTAILIVLGMAAGVLLTCHSGPTDWTAFNENTVEQDLAAIDSAGGIYKAQFAAGNIDAAAQQARAFLLTQPGVDSVAIAPDSTVWAVFANGLLAGLGNDMEGADTTGGEPAPPPRVRVQTDSGGELDDVAHYLLPFDVELPDTKQAAVAIKDILNTSLNWDQSDMYLGTQVTADVLRTQIASGNSVLIWAGHGVLALDGVPALELPTEYDMKVAARAAVSQMGWFATGPGKPQLAAIFRRDKTRKWAICILPAFITTYGNFDQYENWPDYNFGKTIVCLSCCFSAYAGPDGSRPLVQAFRDVGADLVCGYDWAVEDGFARDKDEALFREMSDTCLPRQAVALMGDTICPTGYGKPKQHAIFRMVGDTLVMLRALVRCKKDGTLYRAGSTLASISPDVSIVSGDLHAPGSTTPVGMVTIEFPGNSLGTFDPATEDNAVITWTDLGSGQEYFIEQGDQGVSGTIDITLCKSDVIIGTFTGVLGYWGARDPQNEQPVSTMQIDSGMIKYTGKILQGSK